VLENSALWVKFRLKFANESVEPIIEFPNIFVGSFSNFEILRIKRGHTFFLTSSLHEILFQIFRCFEACWKQTKAERKAILGKNEGSDNWKKEKHARMHGRTNNVRVRVL
jgi:hypothetical protein